MKTLFFALALTAFTAGSCDREEITEQILAPNDGSLLTLPTSGIVPIEFPEDVSGFPENWKREPILAEIEPLGEALRPVAQSIIESALQKYPSEIRKRYLSGVVLVGSLKFYGIAYGGTYLANGKKIILVYRDGFNPVSFEQLLHHEFSSILLKSQVELFPKERWIAGNHPEFNYRTGGVVETTASERSEATKVLAAEQKESGGKASDLSKINPDLMSQGFLTGYSQVSVEQDVNEMAAHLFTNPKLWEYSHEYRGIDHKVDVLIDFYRSLHPTFDRLYFRNITNPRNQNEGDSQENETKDQE